jgi:hypothetical protein
MGLGDFVTGLFGSKNKFRATQFETDPNAYQYGGQPGGADNAANRYSRQAEEAQNRQGDQVNYGQANEDRNMQLQARQGQGQVANMMLQRAMGGVPSIAQQQADRQMKQATAAQASAGASARGAAGMALAQQGAASNTANAQSAISNQAQINAANERMQAEQAAAGAFGAMRGQDLGSQAQSAQQSQFQTGVNMQQRQMNDAMTMGMTQNEMNVRNAQLTASMNQQSQNSANYNAAQTLNAGVAGQNANTNQQNGAGVISAITNVAGGVAMSDERAKTSVAPFITSTWGTGPGAGLKEGEAENQAQQAIEERWRGIGASDRERDARLASSGGLMGGQAVPGFSPGVRDPLDKDKYMSGAQPLQQRDQEEIGLAKAKEAEGVELTEEEERKLGGAKHREGQSSKKASLRDRIGGGLSKAGEGFGKAAASVDTRFHAPNTYSAPNLIPLQSGIEMKTGLRPLSERGINPTGQYMSSDARAKEEARKIGFLQGQASMHDREAESSLNDAGKATALGPMMFPYMIGKAAQSIGAEAKRREAEGQAKEVESLPKREPRTPETEPKRGLVIERGPDREGVPSKAMTSEEMFARPSTLRQPMDFESRFAPAMMTPGALAALQKTRGDVSDERAKNVDRGPLANAARSMTGSEYEYKDRFTPPDQAPGEKNVGPMANNMAQDPVARNIVKRDPSVDLPGGGLVLDQGKMVKTLGAIVADLQRQQDEDRKTIATLSSRMRRKP